MQEQHLKELVENIERWRMQAVGAYHLRVGYMGNELNRVGDHEFCYTRGKLYHRWEGAWREIETGKDFWLFSVIGTFAWARDILTKIVPQETDVAEEDVSISYDANYGYIRQIKVAVGHRASANFLLEVKRFTEGEHPEFKLP